MVFYVFNKSKKGRAMTINEIFRVLTSSFPTGLAVGATGYLLLKARQHIKRNIQLWSII